MALRLTFSPGQRLPSLGLPEQQEPRFRLHLHSLHLLLLLWLLHRLRAQRMGLWHRGMSIIQFLKPNHILTFHRSFQPTSAPRASTSAPPRARSALLSLASSSPSASRTSAPRPTSSSSASIFQLWSSYLSGIPKPRARRSRKWTACLVN